jgi:hypothetical protein
MQRQCPELTAKLILRHIRGSLIGGHGATHGALEHSNAQLALTQNWLVHDQRVRQQTPARVTQAQLTRLALHDGDE